MHTTRLVDIVSTVYCILIFTTGCGAAIEWRKQQQQQQEQRDGQQSGCEPRSPRVDFLCCVSKNTQTAAALAVNVTDCLMLRVPFWMGKKAT